MLNNEIVWCRKIEPAFKILNWKLEGIDDLEGGRKDYFKMD